MDDHGQQTKEGHTMRYMAKVFAVLVVAGAFGVPGLSADGGGDYSAPPPVEEGTVILADGGGDRSGLPGEEAPSSGLV